jgi:hypothetical protein
MSPLAEQLAETRKRCWVETGISVFVQEQLDDCLSAGELPPAWCLDALHEECRKRKSLNEKSTGADIAAAVGLLRQGWNAWKQVQSLKTDQLAALDALHGWPIEEIAKHRFGRHVGDLRPVRERIAHGCRLLGLPVSANPSPSKTKWTVLKLPPRALKPPGK